MTKHEARRQCRAGIVEALERLGFERSMWPPFLQLLPEPANRQLFFADPFQPPSFDRLKQLPDDWAKEADEAWQKHLALQLRRFEYWENTGIYPLVEQAKRTRGARKPTSRRRGLTVESRYEAAALRLMGEKWEVITALLNEGVEGSSEVDSSTVKKAATAVLKTASWLEVGDRFPKKKCHLSGGAEVIVYDSEQEQSLEKESPGCWSDNAPSPVEALKFRKYLLQCRAQQRHTHGDRIPIPD